MSRVPAALKSVELTKQPRGQVYWKDGELIKRVNNVTKKEESGVPGETRDSFALFSFRDVSLYANIHTRIVCIYILLSAVHTSVAAERQSADPLPDPCHSNSSFCLLSGLRDSPRSTCHDPLLLLLLLLFFSPHPSYAALPSSFSHCYCFHRLFFTRCVRSKRRTRYSGNPGGVDFTKGLVN